MISKAIQLRENMFAANQKLIIASFGEMQRFSQISQESRGDCEV